MILVAATVTDKIEQKLMQTTAIVADNTYCVKNAAVVAKSYRRHQLQLANFTVLTYTHWYYNHHQENMDS